MFQSAIAIGVFDGLHKGHQQILNILKVLPYEKKIVIIFEPHPRKILKGVDVEYITPLNVRVAEIKRAGLENIVVWNFSKEFSQTPGKEFINNILVKKYNCKHLVVGFNAHFGRDRDVTPLTLPQVSLDTNITVTICASELYNGIPISSTRIRETIKKGNLYDAFQMLGRYFFIEGEVVPGTGLGHKLGFPTINLKYYENQILPPVGVYFGYVSINNTSKPAMINLGFRPTVTTDNSNINLPVLEFYVVNENIEIVPSVLKVEFIEKIRDEKKFSSLEELRQQLQKDKIYVIEKFINKNKESGYEVSQSGQ